MEDRIRLIKEFADDVRKTFHIETPITDMNSVIERMGGEVRSQWYNSISESAVIKTGKDSFIIRAKKG